jgi:Protein of unknown function (DUF4065)
LTIQQETAKILAPCLYVLRKTGKLSKHNLSKILYFADKLHIAKYGRTLSGQVYIAMDNGPVPSELYNFIKFVQGVTKDGYYYTDHAQHAGDFIAFELPYFVVPKVAPDMDFLSISAIKALDASIAEDKKRSYKQRTKDSHDDAWHEARTRKGQKMSVIEIAKVAGANSAMIEYIKATS